MQCRAACSAGPPCCAGRLCDVLPACLQARLAHEEAIEANAGVWWQGTLQAVPLQEGLAQQRGIKRHADKVGERSRQDGTLPGNALHAAQCSRAMLCCAALRSARGSACQTWLVSACMCDKVQGNVDPVRTRMSSGSLRQAAL